MTKVGRRTRSREAKSQSAQLTLPKTSGWGGARVGAGRKPRSGRRNVPHRARAPHRRAHPVHVTLRSRFRSLRNPFLFPTIKRALADANRRAPRRFRIVEFSVQHDHAHLLVEAEDTVSLSTGMRALMISIARRANRALFRRGRFWADRWHSHPLATPRAVRNALRYLLFNFSKHNPESRVRLDPCSSAPSFFAHASSQGPPDVRDPARGASHLSANTAQPGASSGAPSRAFARAVVVRPETWLLRVGWLRHGALVAGPPRNDGGADVSACARAAPSRGRRAH